MSMMKKFNNLFVNEEDFEEDTREEMDEAPRAQPRVRVSKESQVANKQTAVNQTLSKTNNVILTEPLVFADSKDIIDDIKKNKVVIINLGKLDIDTSDRLLDFISGGIYALNAKLKTIGEAIYLCVPNGVEVSGDFYEGEY
ncbi:cell division protein SepF [Gemella cuniculi]|uniref:cell division protein SepF n=1 Tax=Gemella cuniculi TaxID=150240 RepID=UPI0003F6BFAF|nr:cell division protein SepF [Gemella cuniculi]